MTIEVFNPPGLMQPTTYRQVSVATGSRMVFLAGQVARDAEGNAVGADDLAEQTAQVFKNIATALAAVGASFADVAKLTAFVVDYRPEKMRDIAEGLQRAGIDLGTDMLRPTTLVGVAALFEPDILIEVEAIAVLP